jgi:hypothetical protein
MRWSGPGPGTRHHTIFLRSGNLPLMHTIFSLRKNLCQKMAGTNGNGNGNARVGTSTVKQGLAQMLKGGVIVSCTTATKLLESQSDGCVVYSHA